jgi:hypothetical protein
MTQAALLESGKHMDYKFVITMHGPAVMGEDEVVFFGQFQELLEYYDADPEFLAKARKFVSENILEVAGYVAKTTLGEPAIGGDWTGKLHGLVGSSNLLNNFEFQYLPGVAGFVRK